MLVQTSRHYYLTAQQNFLIMSIKVTILNYLKLTIVNFTDISLDWVHTMLKSNPPPPTPPKNKQQQ